MIDNDKHINLFERYSNNELSESELKDFEAKLIYDSEFKHAFNQYLYVEEGIRNHFRGSLKSRLKEVDKELDKPASNKAIISILYWTSSVAAAIVIGFFIFQYFSAPNYKQIAQNYWPHEEGLPVKMSTKGKYDDAMNAFKLEEWEKAESLLTVIDSDTSAYFLGEIAYRKGDLTNASFYFLQITSASNYYNKAQFKLALIYLYHGDIKKSKDILNFLIEQDTGFTNEIEDVMKRI